MNNATKSVSKDKKPIKEVFTIREGRPEQGSFWKRIGVAFENSDGSWNVVLDALPLDGKLHIRDPRPDEDRARPQAEAASA